MRAALLIVVLASPHLLHAAPGDLDPAFGGGTVQHDFNRGSDAPNGMAALVGGGTAVVGGSGVFAVARHTADGALDASFGDGGATTTPFGQTAIAYAVAEQPDGKLVVVGRGGSFDFGNFVIVRYETDGDPDPTFGGGDGIVTFDLGDTNDEAHAVIVEPGGTLLVIGWSVDVNLESVCTLIRLDGEGDLANSWGGDGIVTADFATGAKAVAAVRRPSDGAIIVAGNTSSGDVAVARFEVDGDPDTTFSNDGFVTADFGGNDGAVEVMLDGTAVVVVGFTQDVDTDVVVARFEDDGDPDMTFSEDGRTTTDLGPVTETRGAVLRPDGRIVALLRSLTGSQLVMVGYEEDGDLDPTFGDGGVVESFRFTEPADMVLEADGSLLVATQPFALARYDETGSLDRTFGEHGRVLLQLSGNGFDAAVAPVVQPDGKIVVVGTVGVDSFALDLLVARFESDGALDPTFGDGDGFATFDFAYREVLTGVTLLPDGRIAATGWLEHPYPGFRGPWLVVLQLEPDGGLDPLFGGGTGRVVTALGTSASGHAIARQPDGKLVVAGATDVGPTSDVLIARFTAAGVLDGEFGTGGFRSINLFGGSARASSLVIQPDGKIVAAGGIVGADAAAALVVRVDDAGTPDPGFGTGGTLLVDFGDNAWASALIRQASGRLVIAGGASAGALPLGNFALAGITAEGELDPTFGTGGLTITPFPNGESFAEALVEAPDGRLIAAGSAGDTNDVPGFALARYTAAGDLDDSFGTAGLVVTPFSGIRMILGGLALAPDGTLVGSGQGNLAASALALARWLIEGGIPSSTTTSTTMPPPLAEICGNCIDDDQNGAADFEDPVCCASSPSFALKRAVMKPAGAVTKLTLRGTLGSGTVDAEAPDLAFQIRPAGGAELLCARIPASSFRVKGKSIRFVDKTGALAGLRKIALKAKKDGTMSFVASANRAAFPTPEAGPIMLTVGGGDGSVPGGCASTMPTFQAKKHGVIKAP